MLLDAAQRQHRAVFASGQHGLDLLRAEPNRADVVLLDLQMPVMDGYEATLAIRQLEHAESLPHTPIIAVTGNAMKGDEAKCLAAGMDDYIPKPLKRGDIEKKLAKWLPPGKCILGEEVQAPAEPVAANVFDPGILAEFRSIVDDSFEEILTKYLHSSAQMMEDLRQGWKAGDLTALAHAAHALKSPSHQIGALMLKDSLAAIERHADKNENAPITALMVEVETRYAAVTKAVEKLLQGDEE